MEAIANIELDNGGGLPSLVLYIYEEEGGKLYDRYDLSELRLGVGVCEYLNGGSK